jgi:predicted SAM-dependent methyltransferase
LTLAVRDKLDIGSGAQPLQSDEWIALDIVTTFRPNVLGDAHHLPFADASLKAVKAHHVLEHIPRDYFVFHWAGVDSWIQARHGLIDVMNEIWRVLEPGGQLWVEVPLFPTEEAIADPTHGSFLVSSTFDYFTRCSNHVDALEHLYTCREDHRRMYGIKPWEISRRERVNHQRILVAFMTKLEGE